MKLSKTQFAKWKAANRPRDPDNPTYQDMKQWQENTTIYAETAIPLFPHID
jgi:hypothetical protein